MSVVQDSNSSKAGGSGLFGFFVEFLEFEGGVQLYP